MTSRSQWTIARSMCLHTWLPSESTATLEAIELPVMRSLFPPWSLNVQPWVRCSEKIPNSYEIVLLLQDSVTQERNQYNTRLEELDAECAHITVALEAERSACSSLSLEKSQLERELESERTRANNLMQDLERECGEKDATLVRNAQVNQQVELVRQELRAQQGEVSELNQRMYALQSQLDERQNELERIRKEKEELAMRVGVLQVIEHDKEAASAMEGRLRASLVDMEEQLAEKHKHIRVLQQRLGDMKKTLQRELKAGGDSGDYEAGVAILTPSSSKTITNNHTSSNTSSSEDDVNFKYLKHVLIKFLTSREYEAQHLTRAVATLLRFSPEEERLLRETLDWKMSWFGSRPRLGAGQTAKAIPPS
uniref:Golgin subfamily A member 1 n=1 Tax=Timema tahoe TaxID=61484 RepID=A0A7R9IQM1_9NEOP|nr:unnamed protein product [Timema tahoe]